MEGKKNQLWKALARQQGHEDVPTASRKTVSADEAQIDDVLQNMPRIVHMRKAEREEVEEE